MQLVGGLIDCTCSDAHRRHALRVDTLKAGVVAEVILAKGRAIKYNVAEEIIKVGRKEAMENSPFEWELNG